VSSHLPIRGVLHFNKTLHGRAFDTGAEQKNHSFRNPCYDRNCSDTCIKLEIVSTNAVRMCLKVSTTTTSILITSPLRSPLHQLLSSIPSPRPAISDCDYISLINIFVRLPSSASSHHPSQPASHRSDTHLNPSIQLQHAYPIQPSPKISPQISPQISPHLVSPQHTTYSHVRRGFDCRT
jgi:hypothetical protein